MTLKVLKWGREGVGSWSLERDQLATLNSKCPQVIHTDTFLQAKVFQVALTHWIKTVLTSLFLLNVHTRKLFEI